MSKWQWYKKSDLQRLLIYLFTFFVYQGPFGTTLSLSTEMRMNFFFNLGTI